MASCASPSAIAAALHCFVVDEIGYPVAPGRANLFFRMIFTSNQPSLGRVGRRVFSKPVVATALLDRLL